MAQIDRVDEGSLDPKDPHGARRDERPHMGRKSFKRGGDESNQILYTYV